MKRGEKGHIIFRLLPKPKGGLVALTPGISNVNVEERDLVVVYIDDSRHRGFYRPLAEGASVVVISPSIKEQVRAEEKAGKQ